MYAVIKTGGRQYRVTPGERIKISRLQAPEGATVTFDQVLMVKSEGESLVGTPLVPGAQVKAVVEEHGRGKKIIVYKFKRRKGYHKKQGHRQDYTAVRIKEVLLAGASKESDSSQEG